MRHLSRILPVIAVIAAVGAAIYHVRSQAAERPAVVGINQQPPAVKQASLVPPSDRYATDSAKF